VTTAAPIRLAGAELAETWHVCAFFNSEEEEYRVLLPFIKDGFACGEKAFHVVNPDRRADHLQRLAAAGIDVRAAEQRGQFELSNNREWYLPEGSFNRRWRRFSRCNATGPARPGRHARRRISSSRFPATD
jgi:hypothetical protein